MIHKKIDSNNTIKSLKPFFNIDFFSYIEMFKIHQLDIIKKNEAI